MFHKLHEDLKSEFSSAHCLPPLPPKSMPMETIARFVLSDEDEVDLSEEQFLRARMRGLQAYLNRLLTIPCVSWSTRLLSFLEPDSVCHPAAAIPPRHCSAACEGVLKTW